jgi:hypothetical protein
MKIFDFKHFEIIKNEIGNIEPDKYYHFFTQARWSSHELLLYLLYCAGKSDIIITSFSISDEVIRTLINASENDLINNLQAVLNTEVKRNKTSLLMFANKAITSIALSNNHMKLTLIESDKLKITVNQSANLTKNPAFESGVICTYPEIFNIYKKEIQRVINNSLIIKKDDFNR